MAPAVIMDVNVFIVNRSAWNKLRSEWYDRCVGRDEGQRGTTSTFKYKKVSGLPEAILITPLVDHQSHFWDHVNWL